MFEKSRQCVTHKLFGNISLSFSPTARVMTLSFSLMTFTTALFCNGVTLQQSTERQRRARSTNRSTRSDSRAMARVRPSIIREMVGAKPVGSFAYRLTSSRVQSRMETHMSCKTQSGYLDCHIYEALQDTVSHWESKLDLKVFIPK